VGRDAADTTSDAAVSLHDEPVERSGTVFVIKVLSVTLIAVFALAVVTFVYVQWVLTRRGVADAGATYLMSMLLSSPVWWLLVAAVLAVIWWLFRGWFKSIG
jgi:hypothetical protein